MSLLGKRGPLLGSQQNEIHTRKQYVDHSLKFLNWVNQLGFERSALGRFAYYLDREFNIRRVLLIFLFSLGLSFLLFYDFQMIGDYSIGEVTKVDVKSPVNLVLIDEVSTEDKRVNAEKSLPIIFDYEFDAYEPVYNRIYKSFRLMRNLIREVHWSKSEEHQEELIKDFVRNKPVFIKELETDVPDFIFEWLVENKFSVRIENILIRAVSNWSGEKIVDVTDSLVKDLDRSVIIRELSPGGKGLELSMKLGDVKNMRDNSKFVLEGIRGFSSLNPKSKEAMTKLALSLLIPNATLNKQEFAERQKKARDSVLPVQISIKKNQTIVAAGNTIQPLHLTILNEIRNIHSGQRTDFLALYSALLFVVLAVVFFTFLRRYSRNMVRVETKDIVVMGVITTMIVLITRLFLYITDTALIEKFGTTIPQIAFLCAAPVAAGSMLVGLLIVSAEIVWIFTVFLGVVMAIMTDLNLSFFLVTIIGGIAAAQGVFGCKKRNDIYWAGLRTGFVNALSIFLIYVLSHMGDSDLMIGVLWSVLGGFIGGIFSSLIAMTFIPLLESMFGYTTDVKLLELSNLTHPLMQEMMMKAPGTYHHCMNVGNMSDAAAKRIGANPLLAKVMAYYHDIGKTEHAQYFAENQRPGFNMHDQVSPHMSKTIIIAHVKDGAEMAIKNKLGKPIVDGILQHHGTTLISYFYNKALEEQDEDVTGPIEESDFRYPGPKPQFKEAALVMLADSIEATARSLEEPTSGRLNSIVENIIESKFMDGQLDECNLSIKDLAEIKDTFKRLLQAMYHHRIEYPHMRDGKVIAVPVKKNNTSKRA
ncbi:MAG: HDIG domain-containing metalloprotein [Bdellovibrionales bacterium]